MDDESRMIDQPRPDACRHPHDVTASSHTCPGCTYVNWCTFSEGHSGLCHCDQGHWWQGNH